MKKLIEARLKNFLGHGNLNSDLWFIGMEEGHDGSLADVRKKFIRTHGKKVFDPRPSERWFGKTAKIQSTWGKLIRILLAAKHPKHIAMDKERVRAFQIDHFGKRNADHSMLDLMPLPCGSMSKWLYAKLGIPHLESREAYHERYRPKRIELFRKLIAKHRPKAVVLCSVGYRKSVWPDLAGGAFRKTRIQGNEVYYRKSGGTGYFVIPHPTARLRLSNEFWYKMGRYIKEIKLYSKMGYNKLN